MNEKFQHLSEDQQNYLLMLLQEFDTFFNGTLGMWKMDPIYFDSKEDTKMVCSAQYHNPYQSYMSRFPDINWDIWFK